MFREHFKNVPGKCSEMVAFGTKLGRRAGDQPAEAPRAPTRALGTRGEALWVPGGAPGTWLQRVPRGPAPQRPRGPRFGPDSWMETIRKTTRVPIHMKMRVSATVAAHPDEGQMLLRTFLG